MTKTAAEIRDELSKRKKKGGKTPWTSIGEGETYIRLGPPWRKHGEKEVWKDVLFHGGFKDKIYCGKNDVDEKTGKAGKCRACKEFEKTKKDRSAVSKALFGLLRQRSENIYNVLVAKVKRDDDGNIKVRKYVDNQFKVLRLSGKWHNMILEIYADEDYRKETLGPADPKRGMLIRVKREGKGRDDTDYHFKVIEKPTPISKDDHERHKLLKTLNDLDKIVYASSSEEIDTFVHKMKKKAKRIAEEEGEDTSDKSDSDSSDSSDRDSSDRESDTSDESDASDSSDRSDSSDNDLERQYKKLQAKIKKRKKHHH